MFLWGYARDLTQSTWSYLECIFTKVNLGTISAQEQAWDGLTEDGGRNLGKGGH